MKNLILAFTLLCFATACQQTGPDRYTTTAPEIDVAKALVTAYEKGDWETWTTQYADSAMIFHNGVEPATPAQLQEGLKSTIGNVSNYSFAKGEDEIFYELIIDDKGDRWVYFWGTMKVNMKANNKEVVIPVHIAWKMVNDKISREYGYYDNLPFSTALAEIEAAAATEVEEE